jgi:DNA-binding transcriptional ArsR family regulator
MKGKNVKEEMVIDVNQLKKAAIVLRAINHKLRVQILKLIHTKEQIIVSDIYSKLRLEQSVTSQHLAILRRAGFVNTERDGKKIYYSVNYQRLQEVNSLALKLLGDADPKKRAVA